ncbi:MFS transporter [Neotabrizicola shimadae]|uniref:MFS transporter n=1 Tax=Neotabrizicola shimadae TaxID=2807096 RepID=A0A8G0ZWC3_9RHOB|nr:MFS transporter [Neotabrizicola shimadae]QYZ69893.1 MFS transporter [Neotabrizicola shimadae]
MRAGLVCLVLAYVLSQFYRAFLAVLTPDLVTDLGMTPEDLALASNLWFAAFALAQVPIGEALDRVGPRLTAGGLLVLVAAGAAVFAAATGPWGVILGMGLIGLGCAPALMASYFIFARSYSAAAFGTFAGAVAGLGSLGNVFSALPYAWVVDLVGWRASVWGLAAMSLAVAVASLALIRDPARVEGQGKGSIMDLLRDRRLWPVFAMMAVCYYPAAGFRDLWVGPWARDVFQFGENRIGQLTLAMGLAMGVGNFLYGIMERFRDHRRAIIIGGNLVAAGCLLVLAGWPQPGIVPAYLLLFTLGLFGTSFPLVMSYGKGMLPKAMLGRGVTLLNFFGIGATGIAQIATGRMFGAMGPEAGAERYGMVFAVFGVTLLMGLAAFAFGRRAR